LDFFFFEKMQGLVDANGFVAMEDYIVFFQLQKIATFAVHE